MFRSALAILIGLIVILVSVQAAELLLVAFLNGGLSLDPATFFGIRTSFPF